MKVDELRAGARDTHISIAEKIGTYEFTISGGFLRDNLNDECVSDIDCFFTDSDEWAKAVTIAKATMKELKARKKSVQFRSKDNMEIDLILVQLDYVFDFDFTMNMLSYDYKNDKILLSKEIEDDIRNKRLVMNKDKLPLPMIERAKKFHDRGWVASKQTRLRLMRNYFEGIVDLGGDYS